MQPNDDLQTTLSKWPFILGDGLLVGTALAIAILGDWQLTNWQVASCVMAVALGAGLYVLPYIVEYQVRVREEAEDRSAELRILRRQVATAEADLEAVNNRIGTINLNLKEVGDRLVESNERPDLSGPLEALEAKLASLTQAEVRQQAEMDKLHERISVISEIMSAKPEADRIEQLAAELEKLQKVISASNDVYAEQSSTPEKQQTAHTDGEVIDCAAGNPPADADRKAAVSRPVREPRKRRTVEPRMLQRAIEQKQDNASAAVSRIIGGKPKEAAVSDLFAETVPPQPDKPRRTKKRDTAVIASVFIGIGNKPYLRGSGAGLNWQAGIAMEFEEIGKWRWIAPAELDEPVEVEVFRNDEDADQNGKHTLEPGQQLEISPRF